MTWENYGSKWQIDHRKPLNPRKEISMEEFIGRCHFTNTQPMWKSQNLSKSNKEIPIDLILYEKKPN